MTENIETPTILHDSEGRRIIRYQSDREWLYDQISQLDLHPSCTLGDIKKALNVDCAAIDICIGLEIAHQRGKNPKP